MTQYFEYSTQYFEYFSDKCSGLSVGFSCCEVIKRCSFVDDESLLGAESGEVHQCLSRLCRCDGPRTETIM